MPKIGVYKYVDVVYVLKKLGCQMIYHKGGSHQIWENSEGFEFTVVKTHGKDVMNKKTFITMLANAGIPFKDFEKVYFKM